MYQNGQDENVAFFWHQICCGARPGDSESLAMARDTKKTDPKAIYSLWMPRRKSPIFKLPVLIQFQVAADTTVARILLIIPGIIAIVVREFLPCSDIPRGDNPDGVRRFLDFTVRGTRMIDVPCRILQGLAIKRVPVRQVKDVGIASR